MRKAIAARAGTLALLFFVLLPAGFGSIPAWGAEAAGDLEARVADLEATTAGSGRSCGGNPNTTTKLPAEAWQGFVIGARIQF